MAGQCGTMGGRRRRRTQKKMKGGNFYGVGAAIAPGVLERTAVPNAAANPVTGAPITDGGEMSATKLGGRRRKSRRGSRKTRKTRRSRKMRGGATFASVAGTGGSFTGEGSAGLANLTQYSTKVPVAGGPKQGPDGVMKV